MMPPVFAKRFEVCAPGAARCGSLTLAHLLTLLLLGGAFPVLAQDTALVVPSHTPLRVQVTRTVALKIGEPFEGKLLEPVYGPDRLLLPAGLVARGVVDATPSIDHSTRIKARLDGDFTPLREPVIRVTQLVLPSGAIIAISAAGGMRNAASISLARHAEKTSLAGQLKQSIRSQVKQAHDTVHDTIHGTTKQDRLRKLLYAQLPYHPQEMWAGSAFDAVLTQPLSVPIAAASQPSPPAPSVDLASGTLHARLTGAVSSEAASKGDAVTAVLTEPFLDVRGRMMLPTGTSLNGVVVQAQSARWFGRSGKLRFSFRSIAEPTTPTSAALASDATQAVHEAPNSSGVAAPAIPAPATPVRKTTPPILATRSEAAVTPIDGHLHSIDAVDGQNVALDPEGGARAQPDKGRFLAPLTLALLGAASHDEDGGSSFVRQGVTSNGFGLPARILAIATTSQNVSTGFAAYAFSKSVYQRWIARGHEVTFPTHTELSIDLGRR